MQFQEFKANVETWQEARGIYEHSTAQAQCLKAISEVGELADAVIKGDREALIDAIGDVAVCLVGVAKMVGHEFDLDYVFDEDKIFVSEHDCALGASFAIGQLASSLRENPTRYTASTEDALDMAFYGLQANALVNNLSLMDCCESAWNQIKDRKGRMVPGGAFVKEGEQ